MIKRIIVPLFACILLWASACPACAAAGQDLTDEDVTAFTEDATVLPAIPDDLTGGRPWIDSTIPGNVTIGTKTSPADDFYLYANKDWIVSAALPEGSQTLELDSGAGTRARVREALAGRALSGHEARQAQLLFQAFTDTGARDAAGCEPARRVIEDIRSLSTVDEISAFLLDLERSAGVPAFVKISNRRDYDAHRWVACVEPADSTFGSTLETMGMDAATVDPDSGVYRARYALVHHVLTRAGYTDEEAKEAFCGRLDLEKEIIRIAAESGNGQDGPAGCTIDQLESLAGGFPLRELVTSRGYGAAGSFTVYDEAALRALFELYTDEYVGALRNYLICGYALEAGGWLDTAGFEAWRADYAANVLPVNLTLPERNRTVGETALNLAAEIAPTLIGRAYVEAFDLTQTKAFITNLAAEAIQAQKEIVNESGWLSGDSKRRLTEKLDGMTLNLVYPEVWEDYSGLSLEGLDYYGVRRAIWLCDLARNASLTGTEIDERLWNPPSLIEGGAAYDATGNSFRVDAGSVEGEVARYQAGEITLEELLGGLTGYLIFHEAAHALDPADIYLGANGEPVPESLLTPADLAEYQRRTDKIKQYFDGISVWEGQPVIGQVCTQEALAEICAMQARLHYATKQEHFDYRTFFETYARLGPTLNTPEYELECILGMDSHPSVYLNTNVTFQQFDEFYRAFDVEEGDGMYLAPDERLVIW